MKKFLFSGAAIAAIMCASTGAHAQNCNVSGWCQTFDNAYSGPNNGSMGVYAQCFGPSCAGVNTSANAANAVGLLAGSGGTGNSYGVYGSSTHSWGGYFTSAANDYGVGGLAGVVNGAYATAVMASNAGAGTGLYAAVGSGGNAIVTSGNVSVTGNITYSGTIGQSSDARLKKDITALDDKQALDSLLKLKGVSFNWIDPSQHGEGTGVQRGFVAQDYEQVFPEWVSTDRNGYKTIQTGGLHALEVEAIRSLKAENDDLKARMKTLETARKPVTMNGDLGLGLGGLGIALAGVFAIGRRKKRDEK